MTRARMARITMVLALAAVLVMMGLFGVNNATAAAPQQELEVGATAPLFTLKDTKGQSIRLADYVGKKVVFLSFWTSR
jgi:cytochrome oxidase Cu insertion factor (SCO1/SenC/PrrC family)